MAEYSGKKSLIQHSEDVPAEVLKAFWAICRHTSSVVLAPVVVGGKECYALALLSRDESGEKFLQVLAYMAQEADELETVLPSGYNKSTSQSNRDLN